MKSVFLLWSALAAFSDASECQADEASLLQARSMVRKHQQVGSKTVLKNLRRVANSLLEGSDSKLSNEDVTDALAAASDALSELAPAIRQQVENAQQQVDHAAQAVHACHAEEPTALRTRLLGAVQERDAAVQGCQDTLGELEAAESAQCEIARDCLCDEAHVRTTDQEALCAAMTETYEAVFCDQHHACLAFHHCHSTEAEVYQQLRADIEAEMAIVVQEYIAVEQAECLTDLITTAMTPPITPISHAALIACDDVDVSLLDINYPEVPPQPDACPAAAHGNPSCEATAVRVLIGNSRNANQKCVTATDAVNCGSAAGDRSFRTNPDYVTAGDTFVITTDGQQVCARRTDANHGWGMQLEIECIQGFVPAGDAVTVAIGNSQSNERCVSSAVPVQCEVDAGHPGTRTNEDFVSAPDTFHVSTNGDQVCARRTDANHGWGMRLRISCHAA